jgi:hypothetical protein
MTNRSWLLLSLLLAVTWTPNAAANLADFDNFNEGENGVEMVDDGIRFYDLDQRLGDPPHVFAIERADGSDLKQYPDFFSPPNVLGFGGYVPGPGLGFGRIGEFKFSIEEFATEARLELFTFGGYDGTVVTMEAWRDGQVAATDAITINMGALSHFTLEIQGTLFDYIRITGDGQDQGVFFGVIDNVVVTGGATPVENTSWGRIKSRFGS